MLTPIEMLNQDGEERNQEIEDDETGNKIVGEIPEGQELFNEVVDGYGLVARDGKNDDSYHFFVKRTEYPPYLFYK